MRVKMNLIEFPQFQNVSIVVGDVEEFYAWMTNHLHQLFLFNRVVIDGVEF